MPRSKKEIDELFQKHGKTGILDIINSEGITDTQDVARLKQKIYDMDSAEESDRLDRRDAREERTLAKAEEANWLAIDANRLASDANRIASNAFEEARRANRSRWKDRMSTIIAITIAVIAARDDIIWLISWLVKIISKVLS